ncbi:flagellar biosynthesis protein FlhB [Shewanella dokdonensis]|uniref:Flagellar biosynthetic protein FlhB n=1 Tax=Shewanella dokdonensis TaxID=712036 RepID=A0ABX8DDG9_9GAMM|nr:flagellar biosynthesis protein FlhB [Shewanella dokdonensis]MCL1073454.1 flagellar biosynthesis protein FlhB [Shewanella dokdonensis]QVK22751.1 flagellar biosynthesis protein FlhB [Shewanella dokdonensis]
MADNNSSQERTEKPTERRLREARKEGQVARSRELNTAVLMMIGIAAFLWFADGLMQMFLIVMRQAMQLDQSLLHDTRQMELTLSAALLEMLKTLVPMLTAIFVAMWIAASLPGGIIFSWSLLAFKGSRLSPLKGLSKIMGKSSLQELLKSIIKICLLMGCMIAFLLQLAKRLVALQSQPLQISVHEGLQLLFLTLLLMATLLLLVAAIDIPFQYKSVMDKVKMTRQEVKEERKTSDGNPLIKNRIRQIQYQFARRRIEERVPKADVIITNPTHFAVALRYSEKDAKAPYVVAKGVDEMALRIRAIGTQHQKEILEIPALARAIYWSTRVDQEVPAVLYTAVAYVLTYVVQLKAYKAGRGSKPAPIPELKIPKNLAKN